MLKVDKQMETNSENFGSSFEVYWNNGFVAFPVAENGKDPFISGILGYKGLPDREKIRQEGSGLENRNMAIAGYFHVDGERDESEFILALDDDDETGAAMEELQSEVGLRLPPTVTISGRGPRNPRRKHLYLAKGHRLQLKSNVINGKIDICSDVQKCVVAAGIHATTKKPIVVYGADGEPLGRPLQRTDLTYAPSELVEYLKSSFQLAQNHLDIEDIETVFLGQLDCREPSHFVQEFRTEIDLERDFGNAQLYKNLVSLVTLVNIHERGTQSAYDHLFWCWHAREHKSGDPEKEWSHSLRSAIQNVWQGPYEPTEFTYRELMLKWVEEYQGELDHLGLEDKFFRLAKGRPLFQQVLRVSERTSDWPIALAVAVLCHIALETPYCVRFKSSLGDESLNLMAVLLGPTGSGKTSVMNNAANSNYFVYPRLRPYYAPTVAVSGEALVKAFVKPKKIKVSGGWEVIYPWRYDSRNFLFQIDEIGLLEARTARQGSTMREEMLSQHSGSPLSREKADGESWSQPQHSYRSVFMIGAQEQRSEWFFNDEAVAAGLAGRCTWVPVVRPDADSINVDEDDFDYENMPTIEPLHVQMPSWDINRGPYYIYPTEELHRELRKARRIALLGRSNPLESHTTRVKARLACLLAIADNRTIIHDDDVLLAELLTQISRRTYQGALRALEQSQKASLQSKGRSDGVRRHFGARRERELDVQHQAKRIKEKLLDLCGTSQMSVGDLRHVYKNNFNEKSRELWSEAVDYLAQQPDLPDQLKQISSLEEERLRESESNQISQIKQGEK